MLNRQLGQWALPDTTHQKKKRNELLQHSTVAAPRSEREPHADFPAQSSQHLTRMHVLPLTLVLVGVTLGMVLNFLWLFGDEVDLPPLPALVLPPSFLLISLMSVGAAAGMVLWIVRSFFKRSVVERSVQDASVPLYPLASASRIVVLPEPYQLGKRFSSRLPSRLDQWTTPAWEMDSAGRKTDALEAQHLRQRLRTQQLAYRDAFPGDQDTEHDYASVPRSVHHQASSAWLQHDVL